MGLVLTETTSGRRPRGGNGEAAPAQEEPPLLSIVVANWEGERWLARCLSSLQVSARSSGRTFELIVVDDASTDGSTAIVKDSFPRARLLINKRNIGFARSVNRAVRAAHGRILLLANNDIVCRQDYVARLTSWFLPLESSSPKPDPAPLFGVSARTVGWYDGKPNQLCMGALWSGGRITPAWSDPPAPSPCLFVQAGAAAYDLRLFRELAGLSMQYEPGYWEDYDLSWRAARRGWRQLYDPGAFALHVGGGSMTKRFGPDGVARMKTRNHLLFELTHLRSPGLLLQWAARIPLRLAREVSSGEYRQAHSFTRGLLSALPRLRSALAARLAQPSGLSDLNLLAPWANFRSSYRAPAQKEVSTE